MKTAGSLFAVVSVVLLASCGDDGGGSSEPDCGDGVVQSATEDCDGSDLAGMSCSDVDSSYEGGTLRCAFDCRFDTTSCTYPANGTANDGFLAAVEPCDGTQFNPVYGTDCSDVTTSDLGTGALICTEDGTLSLENCTQPDLCIVQDTWGVGDGCDPCDILAGNATVDPDPDCDACVADGVCADRWDVMTQGWVCELVTGVRDPDCPVCGDGVRDESPSIPGPTDYLGAGEQCDGDQLGPYTCENLGYSSGTLGCNADCSLDHSSCVP